MNQYEIWSEGYRMNGDSGGAVRIGVASGKDFADACRAFNAAGGFKGFGDFDPERLTVWGCRLFNNERHARASFG